MRPELAGTMTPLLERGNVAAYWMGDRGEVALFVTLYDGTQHMGVPRSCFEPGPHSDVLADWLKGYGVQRVRSLIADIRRALKKALPNPHVPPR